MTSSPSEPKGAASAGVQPKPQERFKGRRGRDVMKFLGSARGAGVLVFAAGETPVSYQIDLYETGAGRTGSGTLDGDLSALSPDDDGEARLRLTGGAEIGVALQEPDDAGAGFETRGGVPDLLALNRP